MFRILCQRIEYFQNIIVPKIEQAISTGIIRVDLGGMCPCKEASRILGANPLKWFSIFKSINHVSCLLCFKITSLGAVFVMQCLHPAYSHKLRWSCSQRLQTFFISLVGDITRLPNRRNAAMQGTPLNLASKADT